MNIVIGSGNTRKVYTLPGGGIMARAAKEDPVAYKELHGNLYEMLKVTRRY